MPLFHNPQNTPLAAPGLLSYRCKNRFGWTMIGATDHEDAMREAARSTPEPDRRTLELWNGSEYVPVWPDGTA